MSFDGLTWLRNFERFIPKTLTSTAVEEDE
jgi:hypothetical protein